MNAYLLIFIILISSIIFSIIDLFDIRNGDNYLVDFYPKSLDRNNKKKILWYFSQITYQVQILLCVYFGLRLFTGHNYDIFYKIIAPISLLVSIIFFGLLYPKTGIHKMVYSNIISHGFNSLVILLELSVIKSYKFKEIFYCLSATIPSLFILIYNYNIRKIWTYNLLNIQNINGRKIISKSIILVLVLSSILKLVHNYL